MLWLECNWERVISLNQQRRICLARQQRHPPLSDHKNTWVRKCQRYRRWKREVSIDINDWRKNGNIKANGLIPTKQDRKAWNLIQARDHNWISSQNAVQASSSHHLAMLSSRWIGKCEFRRLWWVYECDYWKCILEMLKGVTSSKSTFLDWGGRPGL